MRLRNCIGIIVLASMLWIGVAAAEENEITIMGGGHRFRDGNDFRDQVVLRGAFGRHIGSRHGLESYVNVAISSEATRPMAGQGGAARVDALLYGIDYAFHFRPHSYEHQETRLVPYVSIGLGGFVPVGENIHSDQGYAVNAGGGVKYILSRRLAFEASFRMYSADAHRDEAGTHRIRMDSLMTGISVKM